MTLPWTHLTQRCTFYHSCTNTYQIPQSNVVPCILLGSHWSPSFHPRCVCRYLFPCRDWTEVSRRCVRRGLMYPINSPRLPPTLKRPKLSVKQFPGCSHSVLCDCDVTWESCDLCEGQNLIIGLRFTLLQRSKVRPRWSASDSGGVYINTECDEELFLAAVVRYNVFSLRQCGF